MSTIESAPSAPPRKVSAPLAIGILAIPIIFAWFTLRQGYTAIARVVAFCWLVVSFVIIAGAGGDSTSSTPSSSSSVSGGDQRTFSQVATDTLVDTQMDAITDKVARDAIDQYNIAVSGGDKTQICVQAGMVAAAYLQSKNQRAYLQWLETKKRDCESADLPSF